MADYFERIEPTAFDEALDEQHDTRALFNHDPSQILGRSSAGTLRLSVDAVGLRYEIDVPDTQLGRDLSTSIQRGDVTGSSFAFTVREDGAKIERDKQSGTTVRRLVSLNLHDVGPVTVPAFASTTTGVRSEENIQEAREALEAFQEAEKQQEAEAVAVRARRLELSGD
jgi:HK97 family phage prohead protease